MNEWNRSRIDRWIGPVLGLIALAVYGLTLSAGAYPGESSRLIVYYTGLFPRITPDHPIWAGLVWFVSRIPLGGLAFRLNIFSALCGAGSIWLLYEIVAGVIYSTIEVDNTNRIRAGIAARLAGIASAVFLAFCIPFWIVSNRAHTASFHVLLLLVVTGFFFLYARTGRARFAFLFAFLYGLGTVEFATFMILAPLFGLYLIFLLWRHGSLRAGPISGILLCALAGLALYPIVAWKFYGSVGYELRGYTSYFKIIWFMWRDQYFLISRSLPRVGWLIILVMTVVPWLSCLLVAKNALNNEKDWTYYLLHVVVSVLAVAVLINLKFAPWQVLGIRRLLVTPYVLTASVFGYLVAYWYLVPGAWWPDTEKPVKLWIRKWLGTLVVIPGLVLLCVAPFRNLAEADGRPAGFVSRYAEETVNSLTGRSWLVTDGSVDNHLLIAASDLDRPLRVLNLRGGNSEVYMRYVEMLFERPRLKNLARIGMLPLLQEWFESEAEIDKKVAVLWPPDLWIGAGFTIVPHKLVFLGAKKPDELDPAELLADHERFWTEMAPVMEEAGDQTGFSEGSFGLLNFGRHLLRHTGLVANNLGVLMEDLGGRDQAFRAYSKAREIDPDNVSALLNLNVMLEKGFVAEQAASTGSGQAESIKKDLNDLTASLKTRYHIWSLSRYYGYVRTPEAFAQLGWVWALSGQPGMAVSGLKKAMDLLPDDRKGGVKQALAGVYLIQEQDEESEALYYELLVENPDNLGALLGMARIASRKGDFKRAKGFLEKAEQAGVPKTLMALEWASLHSRAGNAGQARIILEELVELQPNLLRAWAMLVGVLVQQNDREALGQCIERMQKLKGGDFLLAVARGHLALFQNDWDGAREYLEEALALNPNNSRVLELLLRLDVVQDTPGTAGVHARNLLRIDPGNALGNYILGSLQFKDGEYKLAEDSFRKSLERQKSPDVLNDLAWLLQKWGSYAEAEKLARAALEMKPKMYNAWDTLGVVLMRTRRLDEAGKAFKRALSIFQNDLRVFVHMAELQAMKGNKKRALELVNVLSQNLERLSFTDQNKVAEIRDMIEATASP